MYDMGRNENNSDDESWMNIMGNELLIECLFRGWRRGDGGDVMRIEKRR